VRLLAAVLLIVGALAAVGFARREGRIHEQNKLAAIATDLAGRPVGVHCPGFLKSLVYVRTEGGYVEFDGNGRPAGFTNLSPETCNALRHIDRIDFSCIQRANCNFKEFKAAWAAHTLAHESFHLRGFQSEAITECYALQNTAFVAERLGVPTQQAKDIQAWLYARAYPNEPDDYRTPECADGGKLDLRPQAPEFP
jgi:hypothetical protein